MTDTTAASRTGPRRGLGLGLLVLVALVLVALVAGNGSSGGGGPLSPDSTSSDGTRGLVLLLQEFGSEVRTGSSQPSTDTKVALLLHDDYDDSARAKLRDWVADGGTLVVADPASELSVRADGLVGSRPARGVCNIDALADVSTLSLFPPQDSSLDPFGGRRYVVESGRPSCFGDGRAAFVVEDDLGRGTIVSVGGPALFTNGLLDHEDNSVLAQRLLQPFGPEPVAVLAGGGGGSGSTTLLDLVPDRVFQSVIQLAIAFVAYALWRSRRLGRPVVEPQPVAIAGSQIVAAVGSLQQRSKAADRAAKTMRADMRRALAERFGLPANAPATTIAEVIAARSDLDRERVGRALDDTPVLDESALLALTQELDTIRKEVLHDSRR